MNIFYLHNDPEISAKMHCDKHVVKMIIEYAQMLSTAHRMLDGKVVKKPSVSGKTMVKHYDLYEKLKKKCFKNKRFFEKLHSCIESLNSRNSGFI